MGHKVHPTIHRTPFLFTWDSKWFAKKDQMSSFLKQEVAIREYVAKKFKDGEIDAISVERTPKEVTITILAGKPGVIIGRSGQGLDLVRKHIERNILQFKHKVKLNIQAVRQPALSSMIVAQNAASEIERRIPFRRVMKQALEKVMAAGAQGVKMKMGGRLNGAEIARSEKLAKGKMSLITLRSHVDYGFAEAQTVYGKIGIKVWIYRGESFGRFDRFEKAADAEKDAATNRQRAPRPVAKPTASK
jgi:small subunit ribosomal protein S3